MSESLNALTAVVKGAWHDQMDLWHSCPVACRSVTVPGDSATKGRTPFEVKEGVTKVFFVPVGNKAYSREHCVLLNEAREGQTGRQVCLQIGWSEDDEIVAVEITRSRLLTPPRSQRNAYGRGANTGTWSREG